jgi:hypothetical protein
MPNGIQDKREVSTQLVRTLGRSQPEWFTAAARSPRSAGGKALD